MPGTCGVSGAGRLKRRCAFTPTHYSSVGPSHFAFCKGSKGYRRADPMTTYRLPCLDRSFFVPVTRRAHHYCFPLVAWSPSDTCQIGIIDICATWQRRRRVTTLVMFSRSESFRDRVVKHGCDRWIQKVQLE